MGRILMKRRFVILVSLFLLSISATSAGKVSVNYSRQNLKTVLESVAEQAGCTLAYSKEAVDLNKTVSINVADAELTQVLAELLSPHSIGFEVKDDKIFLFEQPLVAETITPPILTSSVSAARQQQNVTVHGVVSDDFGEPIIGATIVVKGTTTGVATDMDGGYTIQVPVGAALVFSYIGHITQEFTITSGQTLNVLLKEDSEMLDDLIVIGYGVQRRSVVSAAISSVRGEDFERTSPTRIDQMLRGQVAGVSIAQNSGAPNSSVSIRVRGVGTTGDNSPLFVVDGMIVEGGLSNINPADIASIEVFKDAASAAIFGARGGNGVIMITTHKGAAGKPKINYEMSLGYQNVARQLPMLNSEQYMTLQNEMAVNAGAVLPFTAQHFADVASGVTPNTNWQDYVFNNNAPITSHQLSVRGGNEDGAYFLSLGRFVHEGIMGGNHNASNYDRWTIRMNSDYTIFKETSRNFLNRIRVGVNTSYSRANSIGDGAIGGNNNVFGSALASALVLPPIHSPFLNEEDGKQLLRDQPFALIYGDGRVLWPTPGAYREIRNPLAIYTRPRRTFDNEDKFVGNFWGELSVLPGLVFRSEFGYDLAFWGNRSHRFPDYVTDQANDDSDPRFSSAGSEFNRGFTREISNTLTYNFQLQGMHNFTLLAGQSARDYVRRWMNGTGRNLLAYDPDLAIINNSLADQNAGGRSVSGNRAASAIASYFGRISYDYDSRYIFQGTIRHDGSYKFGANNKWGTFPSFSLAWNVWNEPYLQDARPVWFDTMRPRFSWGINGNDRIDDWRYLALMDAGNNFYFSDELSLGASAGRLPNPDIRWEESTQANYGLDFAFFRNALTFTVDVFTKRTTNMLREAAGVPGYVGQSAPTVNAGIIDNKGVEFDLGYRFSPVRDLSIGIRANASYVKNTVVHYGSASGQNSWGGEAALGLQNMLFQANGFPNPFFYGFRFDGIAQNQAQADEYNDRMGLTGGNRISPGDAMFKDLNGDGQLTAGSINDPGDREMIGKPVPDWTFGATITADYKGFDFNIFFQGVYGVDIFDITRRGDIPTSNRPAWWMGRWHGEGTSNRIPRLHDAADQNNWRVSDLWLQDASYIRLRNIQLGYTLPSNITNIASIERLRLWVGAENLVTWTKFNGFDPEIGAGNGTNPMIGVSRMGNYPQARIVNFGLGVTF
ncbi:MAG: TonB-dependent receptor [Dysgonamonadaceae bacterium]|nr:TonB-dependent receptor [Dysgonamonadaceae bacterium]